MNDYSGYKIWLNDMREINIPDPHIAAHEAYIRGMKEYMKIMDETPPIIMQPEKKTLCQKFIWLFRK